MPGLELLLADRRATARAVAIALCGAAGLCSVLATPIAAQQALEIAIEVAPFPGVAEGHRTTALAEDARGRMWFASGSRLQVHDGAELSEVELLPNVHGELPGILRAGP